MLRHPETIQVGECWSKKEGKGYGHTHSIIFSAVVETSAGNFQACLKHPTVFPKLIGTFAAQTLAGRYGADPSAADWRRFGRLPGFTN